MDLVLLCKVHGAGVIPMVLKEGAQAHRREAALFVCQTPVPVFAMKHTSNTQIPCQMAARWHSHKTDVYSVLSSPETSLSQPAECLHKEWTK
jgi:hypothetical protein